MFLYCLINSIFFLTQLCAFFSNPHCAFFSSPCWVIWFVHFRYVWSPPFLPTHPTPSPPFAVNTVLHSYHRWCRIWQNSRSKKKKMPYHRQWVERVDFCTQWKCQVMMRMKTAVAEWCWSIGQGTVVELWVWCYHWWQLSASILALCTLYVFGCVCMCVHASVCMCVLNKIIKEVMKDKSHP